MDEWINTKDRLPDDWEGVLMFVYGRPTENIRLAGAYMIGCYTKKEGWILNAYPEWEDPEVTHWMYLPGFPGEA